MKVIAGIIFIILVTLIGSRKTFTRTKSFIKEHYLFLTGTEFIVIGYLLGKNVLGFIDLQIIKGLYPFIGLGLGWIGLIYGLQFNRNRIKRFPKNYFIASLFQSLITIFVVLGITLVLILLYNKNINEYIISLLVLSAAASCSSSTIPTLISREPEFRKEKTLSIIKYLSATGDLAGIVLLGIIFSLYQENPAFNSFLPGFIQWLIISILIGIISGNIFNHALRRASSDEAILLIIVGLVLFSGGLSLYLKLSPIFVNLIAGIIISNFCNNWYKVEEIIVKAEKTIYLILLIIAGAMWDFGSFFYLFLAVIYFTVIVAGKFLSGVVLSQSLLEKENLRFDFGLGLTVQSGMATAIIINFQIFAQTEIHLAIVSTVIISIIFSDLISPSLITWPLIKEK